MAKDEPIVLEAVIREQLPNGRFRAVLSNGHTVTAYISGKMRMHFLRIVPGDRVKVELSPYDLSQGRILFRGE